MQDVDNFPPGKAATVFLSIYIYIYVFDLNLFRSFLLPCAMESAGYCVVQGKGMMVSLETWEKSLACYLYRIRAHSSVVCSLVYY